MSASVTALPPKYNLPDKMPRAPLLDLKGTLCNCSSFPTTQSVIMRGNALSVAKNSGVPETSCSDDDNDGNYKDGLEEETKEEEESEDEKEIDEKCAQPNSSSREEDTSLFTVFIFRFKFTILQVFPL